MSAGGAVTLWECHSQLGVFTSLSVLHRTNRSKRFLTDEAGSASVVTYFINFRSAKAVFEAHLTLEILPLASVLKIRQNSLPGAADFKILR